MKPKTIAQNFLMARTALGLTQEGMAKKIKCSRVSISLYETGKINPSADKYEMVLNILKELRSKKSRASKPAK
jgi:transcriptional regulator with XRE-family HTH domain